MTLNSTLTATQNEYNLLLKKVQDLETQRDSALKDGKSALAQTFHEKLRSSKSYDHLKVSVESYSEALSLDILWELCTCLASGLFTDTSFLFQLQKSQLEAMLLKDIRGIRWSEDYPIVLLWCLSVKAKLGPTAYETLLRGFSHRQEDPKKNWTFDGGRSNLQLPCMDTLKVYEAKVTGKSVNFAMVFKWLEMLVANGVSIANLAINFDATDILGGFIVDKELGIVHGCDWDPVKISEFKNWYESKEANIEKNMATKVYQSILSTPDGLYSLLFTTRYIHGEDKATVAKCFEEAIEILRQLGLKLNEKIDCKLRYLCTDLNDGAETWKDEHPDMVEDSTSCTSHEMKIGLNELNDHANLVPLYTYNLEKFQQVLQNSGDRVGQEIPFGTADVNLITVKIKKGNGFLQLRWIDRAPGGLIEYTADIILRTESNNVQLVVREPSNHTQNPQKKQVSYFFTEEDGMMTVVINTNGFSTMKDLFVWKYMADEPQDFQLQSFPTQMDFASLDVIKNHWESIFHKFIPWVNVASRDKQSEPGSKAFLQEPVLRQLENIPSTAATQLMLKAISDFYSIMDRSQPLSVSKTRHHAAKLFFFERKSKLEESGLRDFFSKSFYRALERNDKVLQKIQESDKIDLRTILSDGLIEGAFGIVRMLKGTFDAQEYSRLIGIIQMETLKSSAKQCNIGYSYPRGFNNVHYFSKNQTIKDSLQDVDNGMRPMIIWLWERLATAKEKHTHTLTTILHMQR
jgi:hypothetical protein